MTLLYWYLEIWLQLMVFVNYIWNIKELIVIISFPHTHTDQIRPICLPINEPIRSRDLTGYQPFVAGWGTTSFQGPTATVLQEVQVPIVATATCERNYKSFFPNQIFDNRILCAGYGGRDACQGDSGGPLMLPQV